MLFRLAHISDPHLGPVRLSLAGLIRDGLSLKQALGLANWYGRRRLRHRRDVLARLVSDLAEQAANHLIVSGDLVNVTLSSELETAVAWLHELHATTNVTVVPGNHDAFNARGAARARASFAPWSSAASDAVLPDDGSDFPFVRRIAQVSLIGVTSGVPTPPFMAFGTLGAEQLTRLQEVLRRERERGQVRVVIVHHPPLPGLAPERCGLSDAHDFARVLAEEGAELVLHGHNHRRMLNVATGRHGQVPVVGVPSASVGSGGRDVLARVHYFDIGRIDGAATITLVARGLAEPGGPVVELERRCLNSVNVPHQPDNSAPNGEPVPAAGPAQPSRSETNH